MVGHTLHLQMVLVIDLPDAVYWDKLNEGLYWKGAWQNAVYYDKGDVVRGINNVNHVCVSWHTSEQVGSG